MTEIGSAFGEFDVASSSISSWFFSKQTLRDNRAVGDFSLTQPGIFDDETEVRRLIRLAEIGIDVLDQLEADPARGAAAVAAIRAAFP